jgi:hypothetical protein
MSIIRSALSAAAALAPEHSMGPSAGRGGRAARPRADEGQTARVAGAWRARGGAWVLTALSWRLLPAVFLALIRPSDSKFTIKKMKKMLTKFLFSSAASPAPVNLEESGRLHVG